MRRACRRQSQCPLEVRIEPSVFVIGPQDESRVVADDLANLLETLAARAVIADHAQPALMTLLANRSDLSLEEGGRRVVGPHADRHAFRGVLVPARRIRNGFVARAGGRQLDLAPRDGLRGTRGEFRFESQLRPGPFHHRTHWEDAPPLPAGPASRGPGTMPSG